MLGERIAELRKARGLTQEQLGNMVGVSSQAVSKWEKGGAPDVELLPAIADRLGVSIDGLFGRCSVNREDEDRLLLQWMKDIPEGKRMQALFQLLTSVYTALCPKLEDYIAFIPTDAPCYLEGWKEDRETVWMRTNITLEEGMVLGVTSREFPMFLLLPEPEQGYECHFADNGRYRRLFSALAQKGSLEILRYLYGQKPNYFTAASVAKKTKIPLADVEKAFSAMEGCYLVSKNQVELEEETVDVYMLHDNQGFVPFLYFARWLCEKTDGWAVGWEERRRPILEVRKAKEKDALSLSGAEKSGKTEEGGKESEKQRL